jgi:ADP-heptose:LPS heptosyltransferase
LATLVVRFSSLGDIVLTAGVTGGLGEVVYLTLERYSGLVGRFAGVVEVVGLRPGESVGSVLQRLPPVHACVDLQGSPRSRWLCARLGVPTRRVPRASLTRRSRVAFKWPCSIPLLVDRFAQAAQVPLAARPWISLEREGMALGLVPGAAHATKRWPPARFGELARGWDGEVVLLGGPEDTALLRDVAAAAEREVWTVAESGFERTWEAMARCAVVVGGDTGLVHLAGVCGIPVVGLFGPTTPHDGFWCHPGEVVEDKDLFCRPCSRHGGPRCPLGDHACMEGLLVESVGEAMGRIPGIWHGLDRGSSAME